MFDIIDNVYVRNLITGVDGQDGRILSAMLLGIGEEVFGIARDRTTASGTSATIPANVEISNSQDFNEFLELTQPKRIFHLAASHTNSVGMMTHGENYNIEMMEIHAGATKTILEWQKRNHELQSHLVVALSSQLFGPDSPFTVVDENDVVNPQTKYGESKQLALEYIQEYRNNFGVCASGAILFNHSSTYSKQNFVLHEIARQIALIVTGKINSLRLRDFDTSIDISDAYNICDGINKISRLKSGSEYILSSGKATNLQDLTIKCLAFYGVTRHVELVSTDPQKSRKKILVGNPTKAIRALEWKTTENQTELLIEIVEYYLKKYQTGDPIEI